MFRNHKVKQRLQTVVVTAGILFWTLEKIIHHQGLPGTVLHSLYSSGSRRWFDADEVVANHVWSGSSTAQLRVIFLLHFSIFGIPMKRYRLFFFFFPEWFKYPIWLVVKEVC